MAGISQQTIPEYPTQMVFVDCSTCKGFGYQVNGAKEHIPCHTCHNHPSGYALYETELLLWGKPINEFGIAQRKTERYLSRGVNILLLLVGLAGLAALGYAIYTFVFSEGGDLLDFVFTPQPLTAVFFASVVIDLFLYYRLDKQRASKKQFDYSKKAEHARAQHQFKRPAHPTYEKLHKLAWQKKNDISQFFTAEALAGIEESYQLAKKLGHHQITPLHLMATTLNGSSVKLVMARLGLSPREIYKRLGNAMAVEGISSGKGVDMGLETLRMLFYAYEEARNRKRPNVDATELFITIIRRDPWVNQIFYDVEVDDHTLEQVIEWIHIQRKLRRLYVQWKRKAAAKPTGIMNRALTAQPSPLLESLSQDYTSLSARGAFFPLIGRDNEMEQVLRIITQPTGNILLVGAPGVGKSTILEGVAERMVAEDVPKELQDKRLVVLDPGALVAGAEGIGAIEGRIQQVIGEVARAGNIILGIEDIHHLLNMRSTTGSEDVGSMLMNALSQGALHVIATTTEEEYRQFIVNKGTFVRRFQIVQMKEMSVDDAILVLEAKSGPMEYKHKVFISYAAIKASAEMTAKFIQDRYLPAKALDVLTESAALTQTKKGDNTIVTKEEVAQVLAEKTNVQVTAITSDEREMLLNLEELMHKRIVGQDEAVNAVAAALRRAREGLRDEGRPIANLLFLGPTGVGKTEMAKTIAEVYFGNENTMIRLDMSEYQDARALDKLIGGRGEQGLLTEAIRSHPFSIVLLDEFEKAHPDILNVFLQVMDDGRLTDGTGKTFDMSNMMLIATSNAATQQIQNSVAAGVPVEQIKNQLIEETLPKFFKPELLNRFDNIIVFKPLMFEEAAQIANRMLKQLSAKFLQERGITLKVLPEAVIELAQKGYDPVYGARPLKRVIQDSVNDALAKLLLSQQIGRRDVVVFKGDGKMEIEKAVGL